MVPQYSYRHEEEKQNGPNYLNQLQNLPQIVQQDAGNIKNMSKEQKNDKNNKRKFEQFYDGIEDKQSSRKLIKINNKNQEDIGFIKIGNQNIDLTEQQREIIQAPLNQNLLIQAVTGSGKTIILAIRVLKMIKSGIKPSKIMVLTFGILHAQIFKKLLSQIIDNQAQITEINIENIDKMTNKYFQNDFLNYDYEISQKEHQKLLNDFLKSNQGKNQLNQYDYILFDDFQDMSDIQYETIELFQKNGSFITLIGDQNQNIYGWRKSLTKKIYDKINSIKDLQKFNLNLNMRSQKYIVDLANQILFGQNTGMIANKEKFLKINIQQFEKIDHQLDCVCNKIKQLQKEGVSEGQIAILSYKNDHLIRLQTELSERGIDNVIYSSINDVSLSKDRKNDDWDNNVSLCTFHRSQGMGWENVFIISCNDEIDPGEKTDNEMQQLKNAMYLAVTRCSKILNISIINNELILKQKKNNQMSCYYKKCSRVISDVVKNNEDLFMMNDLSKYSEVFQYEEKIFDKKIETNAQDIIIKFTYENFDDLRQKGLLQKKRIQYKNLSNGNQENMKLDSYISEKKFEPYWAYFLKLVVIELFLQKINIKNIQKLDVYADKFINEKYEFNYLNKINKIDKQKLKEVYQNYSQNLLNIKQDFDQIYDILMPYIYIYFQNRLFYKKIKELTKYLFKKQLFITGQTPLYDKIVDSIEKLTDGQLITESDIKYQYCIVNYQYQFECQIDLVIKDTIIMIKSEKYTLEDILELKYQAALYMKKHLASIDLEVDYQKKQEMLEKYTIKNIIIFDAFKQQCYTYNIDGFYSQIDEYLQYLQSVRESQYHCSNKIRGKLSYFYQKYCQP